MFLMTIISAFKCAIPTMIIDIITFINSFANIVSRGVTIYVIAENLIVNMFTEQPMYASSVIREVTLLK